jgi:predicted nucleotidyltransferase
MEIEFKDDKIIFNRELSLLDSFVLDFIENLEKNNIKYVIISGYVAILFGRSRISEDVDLLIEHISLENFLNFWSEMEQNYECLNTCNSYEAYNEYLQNHLAIRLAKKGSFIPNTELKFVKNDLDRYALEHRKNIKLGERSLYLSPLELQIPYKLFLGSEKDIEDARFLFKLFKDNLDNVLLKMFLGKLKISDNKVKKYLGEFGQSPCPKEHGLSREG